MQNGVDARVTRRRFDNAAFRAYTNVTVTSSIRAPLAPMTSQNGGQDGRHGFVQAQGRVMTSDDPVTSPVSPRKVS